MFTVWVASMQPSWRVAVPVVKMPESEGLKGAYRPKRRERYDRIVPSVVGASGSYTASVQRPNEGRFESRPGITSSLAAAGP